MKSILLIILLAASISFNANSAKLKSKHVIGTWSYTIEMVQGNTTGNFTLRKNKKLIEGEIKEESGKEYNLSKITIKNEKLIFEFQPNEHILVCELKMQNKKLKGDMYIPDAEGAFKITAEKLE